jgi:uracil-DNA glycosylase family 4
MTAPIELANCKQCPINLAGQRNPVLGAGDPSATLAIVGEMPGVHEARSRTPFVGAPGKLLNQTLDNVGMPRERTYTTYAVACRHFDPKFKDDAPVPPQAIACCRPRLIAELQEVKPVIILATGAVATKSLLRSRETLGELQGVVEHRDELPAPVLPTYTFGAALHKGGELTFEDTLSSTKRAVRIAQGKLQIMPRDADVPFQYITEERHACKVLTDIQQGIAGYVLGLDVETDGLDIISDPLLQVSIGNTERGVVFSADVLARPVPKKLFQNILVNPSIEWVIHNSSFDLQRFIKYFDREPLRVTDTMCYAMGITEHARKVGLKILSREHLNVPHYEAEVHQYLNADGGGWSNVPPLILAKYAAKDTVFTARMLPILTELCREEGTLDLVKNILEPAQRAFALAEYHGVLIDRTYLGSLETIWTPKVEESVIAIQDYARSVGWSNQVPGKKNKIVDEWVETSTKTYKNGKVKTVEKPKRRTRWEETWVDEPLNPNSPTQLSKFLFEHLRLRPPGGERTTGKEFRDAYPTHPVTRLLAEHGLMSHMMGTYVKGMHKHIRADGRVHPSFMLAGARTGRLAMHNPPLQTIPAERLLTEKDGTKRFDSIKRMYLPSEGHLWGETDYSQLELRVAWHLSGDEALGEALMTEGDFHRNMASKLFKVPVDKVTEMQRHSSKTVTFGLMYGRQAKAIAEQLTAEGTPTSTETAQGYIDDFFALAHRYADWYQEQHHNALTIGRSVTPFGRVRRWNIITRENRQNVLNQSVNYPVQSTANELTLLSFIKLTKEFKARNIGTVLFPVHDSVNYEFREGREAEVVELVNNVMTQWPFESVAILETDTKIGRSWGDCKAWQPAA